MPNLALMYSTDSEGDDCVLLQIVGDDGTHVRYATEEELKGFLHSMNERLTDDSETLEIPEGIGICLECGGECVIGDDASAICENACDECGEHYEQDGDGYDGKCGNCADRAMLGECDNCGRTGMEIVRTDDDGDRLCVECDEAIGEDEEEEENADDKE